MTQERILLGGLSQAGKRDVETVAHDVGDHHLKRRKMNNLTYLTIVRPHLGLLFHGHLKHGPSLLGHGGLVLAVVLHLLHGVAPC